MIRIQKSVETPVTDREIVVMLKGWALNVSGELIAELLAAAEKTIREVGATLVVWDGDALSEASFTAAIPKLAERMPTLRFLAFNRQGADCTSDAKFLEGMHSHFAGYAFAAEGRYELVDGSELDVFSASARFTAVGFRRTGDQEMSYVDLALMGYGFVKKRLRSELVHVVCLGGGAAINDELLKLQAAVDDGSFAECFPRLAYQRLPGTRTRPSDGQLETVSASNYTFVAV